MIQICLITAVLGASTVYANTAAAPAADELVDRLGRALEATSNFIEDYEQTTQYAYRLASGADSGTGIERGHIRHDGQRCYYLSYRWGDYNLQLKNLPPDRPYYHCLVIDGRKRTVYHNNMHLKEPNSPGTVYRQPLRNKRDMLLNTQFGAAYLMGYVGGDERLDTVLRKADRVAVRSGPETVNGMTCTVLDAETDHGRYAVWLASEHGWLPAQIHQRGGEGDISYGHQLTEGQTAVHYLKNVRFEQVDGVWVPMEADAGCSRRTPEGHFVKEDYHYRRIRIDLNPDHDRRGSFADPLLENSANDPQLVDGIRIHYGMLSKEYIWQDGKMIDPDAENERD